MDNEDSGYPASDVLVEDQAELRFRFAQAIMNDKLFGFTLSSSQKPVEGRLTRHRTGGQEGVTALTISVALTDGTKAKVYVPSIGNDDPIIAHFFTYGPTE